MSWRETVPMVIARNDPSVCLVYTSRVDQYVRQTPSVREGKMSTDNIRHCRDIGDLANKALTMLFVGPGEEENGHR